MDLLHPQLAAFAAVLEEGSFEAAARRLCVTPSAVSQRIKALEDRLQHIKTPLSLSVLGCVVNGPGEARETDIGITGGGNGKHMVYLSGVTDHHVQSADMLDHIVTLVEAKAAEIEAESRAAAE